MTFTMERATEKLIESKIEDEKQSHLFHSHYYNESKISLRYIEDVKNNVQPGVRIIAAKSIMSNEDET